jgi:hypothetical protein
MNTSNYVLLTEFFADDASGADIAANGTATMGVSPTTPVAALAAARALDRNASNALSSALGRGYVQIDLGAAYSLTSIRLFASTANLLTAYALALADPLPAANRMISLVSTSLNFANGVGVSGWSGGWGNGGGSNMVMRTTLGPNGGPCVEFGGAARARSVNSVVGSAFTNGGITAVLHVNWGTTIDANEGPLSLNIGAIWPLVSRVGTQTGWRFGLPPGSRLDSGPYVPPACPTTGTNCWNLIVVRLALTASGSLVTIWNDNDLVQYNVA